MLLLPKLGENELFLDLHEVMLQLAGHRLVEPVVELIHSLENEQINVYALTEGLEVGVGNAAHKADRLETQNQKALGDLLDVALMMMLG